MATKNLITSVINISVQLGVFIAASFMAMLTLPNLRGANTPAFLIFYFMASGGYVLAILRLNRDHLSIRLIFGFAVVFRLILLLTTPSLSDDVYRYVWDGHLLNNRINPYALAVNSPRLDAFDIPLRALVNHNWMASPYLPASQLVFASVAFLIPQQILAFQVTAVLFDLLTGWIVFDILRRFGLPGRNVLVYLWNPLIIIEFAHSAHVDAVMLCLMMTAFWLLIKGSQQVRTYSLGSAIALAAATLTKFLPILLTPIFWWRWGWKSRLVFVLILIVTIGIFIPGAGLGILGPLDGTGFFGALRIYLQWWNYNGGIYHWLEVMISGYPTPGAVPVEMVGETPILIAKAISTALMGITVLITGWLAWRIEKSGHQILRDRNLALIRLAGLPLGAYLLFTATVHPWYVTLIIPLLPFLFSQDDESPSIQRFIWPWIYFSIAVALSYLTYLDPDNLRETTWVRLVEYIPMYGLLVWAFWLFIRESKKSKPFAV